VKGEEDVRRVRHKIEGEYRAMMEEENIEPPAYIDRMFESKELPPDVEIKVEQIDPDAEEEYNWRWEEEAPEAGDDSPRSATTKDAGGTP
jgi:hypothetical protein